MPALTKEERDRRKALKDAANNPPPPPMTEDEIIQHRIEREKTFDAMSVEDVIAAGKKPPAPEPESAPPPPPEPPVSAPPAAPAAPEPPKPLTVSGTTITYPASVPDLHTAGVTEIPNLSEKPQPVFDVNPDDFKHFQSHQLAVEKKKSLDAIEQAVKDSCAIAEAKIRNAPEVVALAADPADIALRMAFLKKFGPKNIQPPRPLPNAYGPKDPELMRWIAAYEPDEFIKTYGHGQSPLVKELMAGIRRAS